jgi:hypothetical protein
MNMDFVTCCNNEKFFNLAKKLIASYLKFYPKAKVVVGVFGDMAKLAGRISDQLEFVPVPQDCEHAWNPRFYYFKNATMKYAIENCRESFVWMDSANIVVDRLIEIEEALEEKGRFFDQYPNIEFYKLKYYTSKTCLEHMGHTIESVSDWYGYQSLVQAYAVTEENKRFIDEMLQYMKDPLVAGPSNYTLDPDGPGGVAHWHRNDLSVLSVLIPRYKFDQPYDYEISRRYGDRPTYELRGGSEKYVWEPRMLVRQN